MHLSIYQPSLGERYTNAVFTEVYAPTTYGLFARRL